jgi:hypothetical protein
MTFRIRAISAACRVVLAAVLLPMFGGPGLAQSLGDTLDRIYAENDFQSEMPVAAQAATNQNQNLPEEPAQQPPSKDLPREAPPLPDDSAGDAIRIVGIFVFGLILLVILYIVVSSLTGLRLGGGRQKPRADEEHQKVPVIPQEAPGRLGDADALARQGRHAEAIHLLLLAVITALRDGSHGGSASTTVREIVGRAPLAMEPKNAFTALALTAELVHFGGRNATSDRYEACREHAHIVLAALPRGAS